VWRLHARAAMLNVTQSAVSRQVRQLEDQLGEQLLERHHHQLELTDAGRALLRTLQQSFDRIELTVRAIQPWPHQPSRRGYGLVKGRRERRVVAPRAGQHRDIANLRVRGLVRLPGHELGQELRACQLSVQQQTPLERLLVGETLLG
jgi:DNA-binding MarR family transcriptional regulator